MLWGHHIEVGISPNSNKKIKIFLSNIWKECTVINLLSTKQGDQNVCLGSTHIFSQQQQVYVHSVFYNITFYEFTYIIQ